MPAQTKTSFCPTCGAYWLTNSAACPLDGALLAVDEEVSSCATAVAERSPLPSAAGPGHFDAGTKVGDYVVVGTLGEGGMATVYAALHPIIGKKAAIKVMNQETSTDCEAIERFLREARAVNRIGHPNIVDVFAWGTLPDGRRYFMMEWLQGQTLAQHITAKTLGVPEKLEVLIQICDALEAAHAHGIVHRDLKPDNVQLVPVAETRKLVKLLDFGIAKLTAPAGDPGRHLTQRGFTLGTPEYLSPEQARGRDVDHRTDIYALGVLAYELLCGRLPFQADNAAELVSMHLADEPPAPVLLWPGIPLALERLLLAMLEKTPDNRPGLDEIRRVVLDARCLLAGQTREPPRRTAPVRALRAAAIVAVGVLAALATYALVPLP